MKSLDSSESRGFSIGCDNEANRHAWVRTTLGKIPPGARILDAGAGTQRYREFCGHLNYVAQDFAQYDGVGDKVGLQTGAFNYGKLDIVSDIQAVPEPDESFDAVLCTEVLEHVPNPAGVLREMVRLLKPEGHLILTAPFVSFTHFAPYHFCTGFNRYYYLRQFDALGLEVIELSSNGGFFDFVAQELRRVNPTAQRYARGHLTLLERLAQKILLRALARFKASDRDSHEFACFGLHVHARKRSPAP